MLLRGCGCLAYLPTDACVQGSSLVPCHALPSTLLPLYPSVALAACAGGSSGSGEASPAVSKRLHELLAMSAMQFGGYIFRLSESQVGGTK